MCFGFSKINKASKWNWDGDQIVHDSIVPSSRPPIGSDKRNYDIDVREFLVADKNVVMRRTLEVDLRKFLSTLPGGSWDLFRARTPGAFDYRVHVISEFLSKKIAYRSTGVLDPWQFPEETISLKHGDCEDRALLIASLFLASGISSFNVRVALGKFRAWINGMAKDFDHVWVMYKNESGAWQIVEPTHARKVDAQETKDVPERAEYIPLYLFNDVHLWQVTNQVANQKKVSGDLKRNWSSLNPKFAGWVHKGIINDALHGTSCPEWVLKAINSHFTSYFGRKSLTVDDVDMPGKYDPRDHFDNGFISEGWLLVKNRLAQFHDASLTNIDSFYLAAHGIADFYAHSSFAHFGKITNGSLSVYDPDNPGSSLAQPPFYGNGSSFDFGKFSSNSNVRKGSASEASKYWQGQLISGRYGQVGDSHSIPEAISFIPSSLVKGSNFYQRCWLPHHNEIAVDEDTRGSSHTLYDQASYSAQYRLRYEAAVNHIRQAFDSNWNP